MIVNRIRDLLSLCEQDDTHFPPTDLYSEGWMLRLCLDWLASNTSTDHQVPIPCPAGSNWYSEALLPSQFLSSLGDKKLAEAHTHADGVVGQFSIGERNKGELNLDTSATCFVVVEAKINSKLSAGVSNARYYNQAARNVACMAEIIRLANVPLEKIEELCFFVTAPASRIEEGVFDPYLGHDSIREVVTRRVGEYGEEKLAWYHDHFLPLMDVITISTLSWEQIVDAIVAADPDFGEELSGFYANCLKFN